MPSTDADHSVKLNELSDREQSALSLWIGNRDETYTTTEIGNELGLENTTQRTRLFRQLEEYGLVRTWMPEERGDNRPIPPAIRGELTSNGRAFVEQHAPHLKPESEDVLERVYRLEQQVDELANQLAEQEDSTTDNATDIKELTERLDTVEANLAEAEDKIWEEFLLERIQTSAKAADNRSDANAERLERLAERVRTVEDQNERQWAEIDRIDSLLDDIDEWLRDSVHPTVELIRERWNVRKNSPVYNDDDGESNDGDGFIRKIFRN